MNTFKKISTIAATVAVLSLALPTVYADESNHRHSAKQNSAERMGGHQHAKHEHDKSNMDEAAMGGMFLEKREVDGYKVSFHIMAAKDGMQHGGSHNLMVKVEANGMVLTDVSINSKVFYADKSTDSKMLMKMGDWYMAGYDLGQTGKHGIMVLFKTADGQKHKTSVYYSGGK